MYIYIFKFQFNTWIFRRYYVAHTSIGHLRASVRAYRNRNLTIHGTSVFLITHIYMYVSPLSANNYVEYSVRPVHFRKKNRHLVTCACFRFSSVWRRHRVKDERIIVPGDPHARLFTCTIIYICTWRSNTMPFSGNNNKREKLLSGPPRARSSVSCFYFIFFDPTGTHDEDVLLKATGLTCRIQSVIFLYYIPTRYYYFSFVCACLSRKYISTVYNKSPETVFEIYICIYIFSLYYCYHACVRLVFVLFCFVCRFRESEVHYLDC